MTLVLCTYNGVKKKKSCHWCLPSSILSIWDLFRPIAAIYNIHGTSIPYRFTAEKSRAIPCSLLCSRLNHAIPMNIKDASQKVCQGLVTDGCIWCTVGFFSLQRNISRRRNKLLAPLPQQAAGWEPEKLWVQNSFACSQSPQLLQKGKTRQFHQEAEGHELAEFFSLL